MRALWSSKLQKFLANMVVHGVWFSKRRCSSFEPIFWRWVDISNAQPKVELVQNYAAKKPFCLIDCVFNHINCLFTKWIPEIRVVFFNGLFFTPNPQKNSTESTAQHHWATQLPCWPSRAAARGGSRCAGLFRGLCPRRRSREATLRDGWRYRWSAPKSINVHTEFWHWNLFRSKSFGTTRKLFGSKGWGLFFLVNHFFLLSGSRKKCDCKNGDIGWLFVRGIFFWVSSMVIVWNSERTKWFLIGWGIGLLDFIGLGLISFGCLVVLKKSFKEFTGWFLSATPRNSDSHFFLHFRSPSSIALCTGIVDYPPHLGRSAVKKYALPVSLT